VSATRIAQRTTHPDPLENTDGVKGVTPEAGI
jgi:hypothetical protein